MDYMHQEMRHTQHNERWIINVLSLTTTMDSPVTFIEWRCTLKDDVLNWKEKLLYFGELILVNQSKIIIIISKKKNIKISETV